MSGLEPHSLTVRGAKLEVLVGGQPDGTPMLWLHGMRDVAASLAPIATRFGDDHRLLLANLRGHGGSDHADAYSFELYLNDIYRTLLHFDATPAILVGHSLGGQIAARFAAMFPHLVSHLVLIEGMGPPELPPLPDTASLPQVFGQRLVERFAERPPSRGMANLDEASARLSAANPRLSALRAAEIAANATEAGGDGRLRWRFDHHVETVFARSDLDEVASYWRAIRCPTLVISGDLAYEYWQPMAQHPDYDGRYGPGEMDARAAMIPQGRHVPFQRSGHMVHFDEPERLAQEVRAFLNETA